MDDKCKTCIYSYPSVNCMHCKECNYRNYKGKDKTNKCQNLKLIQTNISVEGLQICDFQSRMVEINRTWEEVIDAIKTNCGIRDLFARGTMDGYIIPKNLRLKVITCDDIHIHFTVEREKFYEICMLYKIDDNFYINSQGESYQYVIANDGQEPVVDKKVIEESKKVLDKYKLSNPYK